MADIKARRLAFIACGWLASSWLAIKYGMENTIRKRNADAVKTTKFLCIMAASGIGLFRLFSLRFNAEYKTFNNILQCYFSSSKPVLSESGAVRKRNEARTIRHIKNMYYQNVLNMTKTDT